MSLDEATHKRISDLIGQNRVMLFMKGDRHAPQCGFSARVIDILEGYTSEYETLDVLSNPDIRAGIKEFSSWPTIPQLYVSGEFVGGCDIITEMNGSGELFEALGVEAPPEVVPEIHVTAEAAEGLRQAAAQAGEPGQELRLAVSRQFEASLSMGPRSAMDVVVETAGLTLLVDRLSAPRANGIRIDLVDTPRGRGFKVDNPNAPTIGQMSVQELAKLRESGEPFELIDVRTPTEWDTARIEGATLLDEATQSRLAGLPKDTKIVFVCHHGPRGDNAAQHFVSQGFTNVHNVVGGIDAWSREIDPSVPLY